MEFSEPASQNFLGFIFALWMPPRTSLTAHQGRRRRSEPLRIALRFRLSWECRKTTENFPQRTASQASCNSGVLKYERYRGGMQLIRTTLFVLAIGWFVTGASAMPALNQAKAIARPDVAVNVKVICEQDGHCYQRGRRPVARWVYGEGAFHGPGAYVGPGYYGRPDRHWAWWAFLGF